MSITVRSVHSAADVVQHCFGLPGGGGPATALDRFLSASAETYPVIWQRVPARGISPGLLWSFYRQLRRYRPKLVHVRGLGNEGFHGALAAWLARVPNVLVSIHGTHRDLVRPHGRLRRWLVTQLLEPLTLRLATHVTTVCEATGARSFLDPYRSKLLPPVPNGVVLPPPPTQDQDDAEGAAVKAHGRPIVVTVSRLSVEKGCEDLAAALHRIDSAGGPGFDLVVVGGGDSDGRIRALFEGLRHVSVRFVGESQEVGRHLAASDIFVLASWHENLSNALLEAMSYGLPVIATDVGGNREVVLKGGGVLVDAHSPEQLARALSELLANPARRRLLGREARANIQRHYSIARMVAGWEETYRQILGHPT